MNRLERSDSMAALMCPTPTDREIQSMLEGLEEEGCVEKKRRLSISQVNALEKNFEIENKLEPDRKAKLAHELGLQPRQVAVWFQNRRARWKTKQLERDYGILKSIYDDLKLNYESLVHDKDLLTKEVTELKSKLGRNEIDRDRSLVNEGLIIVSELDEKGLKHDLKDGSSDSDSSALLHEEQMQIVTNSSCSGADICDYLMGMNDKEVCQPQFVKTEEHNFSSVDETYDFFSDEQAPTLQWYSSDAWN